MATSPHGNCTSRSPLICAVAPAPNCCTVRWGAPCDSSAMVALMTVGSNRENKEATSRQRSWSSSSCMPHTTINWGRSVVMAAR